MSATTRFVLGCLLSSCVSLTCPVFAISFENRPQLIRADHPVSVEPVKNLDEELFLLYVLDNVYHTWPPAQTNASELSKWLKRTDGVLARLQDRAWSINEPLGSLYLDCRSMIRRYQRFLESHQLINEAADEQAENSKLWSAAEFGVAVGTIDFAGALVSILRAAFEEDKIELARYTLLQQESETLDAEGQSRVSLLQDNATNLAKRRSWKDGEIDFSNRSNNRPRDPFLRLARAGHRYQAAKRLSAEDLFDLAKECVFACRRVPKDPLYDEFRAGGLYEAVRYANMSCALSIQNNYSNGPAKYGPAAVCLCLTAIDKDPTNDVSHMGARELARALGMSGRYQDALLVTNNVDAPNDDHGFYYRRARLFSLTGDCSAALENLTKAYELGFDQIDHVRTDPDLELLRDEKSDTFARLTKVSWEWRFDAGSVMHSVTLTNTSPFKLTNIAVEPRMKLSFWGDNRSGVLTVDELQPGRSFTWHNAFIDIRQPTAESATLSCDQQP